MFMKLTMGFNDNSEPAVISPKPINDTNSMHQDLQMQKPGNYSNPNNGSLPVFNSPQSTGNDLNNIQNYDQLPPIKKSKKIYKRPIFIIPLTGSIILIGLAIFYFGFWTNPNYIWSQFLYSSNIGFNQISKSLSQQSSIKYSGYNIEGTVTYKNQSGDKITTSLNEKNNGSNLNSDLSINNNTDSSNNFSAKLLTIPVKGSQLPDVYVKLNGNKTIDKYLNDNLSVNNSFSKYSNQWVSIDHDYLSQLISKDTGIDLLSSSSNKISDATLTNFWKFVALTSTDNKKYLFSSGKVAVLNINKKIGFENINGVRTYHYLVGFNNTNLQKYYQSLVYEFMKSDLSNDAAKATGVKKEDIQKSLLSIKPKVSNKTTVGMWINANTHILSRIRFGDSYKTYLDFNFNYSIGSPILNLDFHYVVIGKNGSDTDIKFIQDTKTLKTNIAINSKDFNANASLVPMNDKFNNVKPAQSVKLDDVLNYLGGNATQITSKNISNANSVNNDLSGASNVISNAFSDYENSDSDTTGYPPNISKVKVVNGGISIDGKDYLIDSSYGNPKITLSNYAKINKYSYSPDSNSTGNQIGNNNMLIIFGAKCDTSVSSSNINDISILPGDETNALILYPEASGSSSLVTFYGLSCTDI